ATARTPAAPTAPARPATARTPAALAAAARRAAVPRPAAVQALRRGAGRARRPAVAPRACRGGVHARRGRARVPPGCVRARPLIGRRVTRNWTLTGSRCEPALEQVRRRARVLARPRAARHALREPRREALV